MLERPIFVVGTQRSGSTLFRLVLDAHPHISISEETGFMAGLAATRQIPNWQHGRGWFQRIGWGEEEFDERLRQFYAGLFERHALAQGKKRWGEKTPFHSGYMAQMAAVFPDAVFVGIVRHPGAVVHSLVGKFHYRPAEAADYWSSTNREILRRGLELGEDRFSLLRYEDLVQDTEGTLRELLDWLDEPWSDDVLRHNEVHAARGAPRIAAGNTRTRDPIKADLGDRWAEAASGAEREELRVRTGELAGFFGYDPGTPGTAGPLLAVEGSGRHRLLTGGALRRWQDGPRAVSLAETGEAVVMPEMDAGELAKRLHVAETALTRIRSRRAVRWTNALRRTQRRVAGLPWELRSAAAEALRGPRGGAPRR